MIEVRDRHAGGVAALTAVDPPQIHLYGCAAVDPTGEEGVVRVTGLGGEALPRGGGQRLRGHRALRPGPRRLRRPGTHAPGRGGEIRLTDALGELAVRGAVHGVVLTGPRYDTGDRADHLSTVVRLACGRPDLGPEFVAWLEEFVTELDPAGTGTAASGGTTGTGPAASGGAPV